MEEVAFTSISLRDCMNRTSADCREGIVAQGAEPLFRILVIPARLRDLRRPDTPRSRLECQGLALAFVAFCGWVATVAGDPPPRPGDFPRIGQRDQLHRAHTQLAPPPVHSAAPYPPPRARLAHVQIQPVAVCIAPWSVR